MADETTERHFPPPFVITVCAVVAVGLYVLLTFKDGCPPSGNLDAFYPLAIAVTVVGEGLTVHRRGWSPVEVTVWVVGTGLVVALAIVPIVLVAAGSAGCFS